MTDKFLQCIPIVLRNEGGFVNNQRDPGGATKYGISLRFLKSEGHLDQFDLDHDGDLDIDDIRLLDPEKAKEIYYEFFWKGHHLDEIEDVDTALQIFDHSVNAGTKTAVRLLQDVLEIKEDGVIGPKTIEQVNSYSNIAELYCQARKTWYGNLVLAHPNLNIFLDGWLNRCDKTTFLNS